MKKIISFPEEQAGIFALSAEENDASAHSEDPLSKSYSILLQSQRPALGDQGGVRI